MSDILPIDKHALAQRAKTAQYALDSIKASPCTTPEQEASFRALAENAHKIVQGLEDERKELVKPHNAVVDEINEAFRPVRTAFQAVKDLAKQKVSARQTALALEAQQAKERAFAASEAGRVDDVTVALASVPEVAAQSWTWECTVEDLAKVPTQFLVLDVSACKQYCKTYAKSQVIPEVPGLKFTRKAVVRV